MIVFGGEKKLNKYMYIKKSNIHKGCKCKIFIFLTILLKEASKKLNPSQDFNNEFKYPKTFLVLFEASIKRRTQSVLWGHNEY